MGVQDLQTVSAEPLVFNQNNSNEFSNYGTFRGTIAENGEITIWKHILKREQTTTDKSIIRIEAGRDLSAKYDPNGDTVNSFPFNIILEEASILAPSVALVTGVLAFLF